MKSSNSAKCEETTIAEPMAIYRETANNIKIKE